MSTTAIKFFEQNPRATAKEAGITSGEANALVGRGLLIQAGKRKTGKKGKPPYEYVTPDYDMSIDPEASANVEAAKQRVRAFRLWERYSGAMMRAHNEYGYGSDEHTEAKLTRREAFPLGPPEQPSPGDYALAGAAVADLPLMTTGEDE
jgi:hypothetical protein